MGFPEQSHPHSDLTAEIIGASQEVHRALKPGLDEKVYENSLCVELGIREIRFNQQKNHPIYYKEHYVGKLIPDLIVDDRVLVDAKAVESFNDKHTAQMLGYLNITGLEIGLLINFKQASLQVKRIANLQKNQSQSEQSVVNLLDPPTPSEP